MMAVMCYVEIEVITIVASSSVVPVSPNGTCEASKRQVSELL